NRDLTVLLSSVPLIYNIREDKWVNRFSPILPTDGPPTPRSSTTSGPIPGPTNPTPNTSPSSGSNAAAIGKGVAGDAVILRLLVFLFYRRRKQVNSKSGHAPDSSATPLDGSAPPAPPTPPSATRRDIDPQGQNVYADNGGIEDNEPFAYGSNIDKDNNRRNSDFFGPRNPQEYTPTATKKPHDLQYQPMNPTAIGQECEAYSQRRNGPQGDGTNVAVVSSGAGGGGGGGMDGLGLRQQITYIQAQNQDIGRVMMEQQQMLRKLQDLLDSKGENA
ncbi:hypothetical protein KI688_007956, partial [Linnemannia hyalina]